MNNIGMGTFGLHSINVATLNIKPFCVAPYPKKNRDILITSLKVYNLVLKILGYIPGVSVFSGSLRMVGGAVVCCFTTGAFRVLPLKDLQDPHGNRHVVEELQLFGAAQIARGAFEAFVPFGKLINGCWDIATTYFNVSNEKVYKSLLKKKAIVIQKSQTGKSELEEKEAWKNPSCCPTGNAIKEKLPYSDPKYPGLASWILYLA